MKCFVFIFLFIFSFSNNIQFGNAYTVSGLACKRSNQDKAVNDKPVKKQETKTTYTNEEFGYCLQIPESLEVVNTYNPYIFALRFPVVAQAANAFMIKVLPKDQFAGFEEMHKSVIESLSREENKQIAGQVYLLDSESMDEFKQTGPTLKVHVLDRGKEFVCCYVFAESPKAYLWIDFVATKESYDINFPIMQSLMQDFEILGD